MARAELQERLPGYMVPMRWVGLEELPLTPNGKIDRRRLPAPDLDSARLTLNIKAPRNELETKLTDIWCRVLEINQVGVDSNFFDLGGHSLLMLQVQRKIEEELGYQLSVLELFKHPTLSSLAEYLAGKSSAQRPPIVEDERVEIRMAGRGRLQQRLRQRQENIRESKG
jgi:acyl carrier protein